MKKFFYIFSFPATWIAIFGIVVALATLMFPSEAEARAGGGTSAGRASSTTASSRTSSFSSAPKPPSYSAPSPAPSFKPSPAPTYTPKPPAPTPDPVPATSPSRSSFWSGFAGGAAGSVIGNWLSSPSGHAGSTILNSGGVAPAAQLGAGSLATAGQGGSVIVQESAPSAIWAWLGAAVFVAVVVFVGIFALGAYQAWRKSRQTAAQVSKAPTFDDPVKVFYTIQQAVNDHNAETLIRMCSAGLANVFLSQPASEAKATDVLAGLQWWYTDPTCDGVEDERGLLEIDFLFNDFETKSGAQVRETWVFQYGRLVGIDVHA